MNGRHAPPATTIGHSFEQCLPGFGQVDALGCADEQLHADIRETRASCSRSFLRFGPAHAQSHPLAVAGHGYETSTASTAYPGIDVPIEIK